MKTDLSLYFPVRNRDAHKGDFGHVLIIGGDHGMGGAVRLSAEAALRVGAGLVSVATRPENVSLVCSTRPEIMCHGIQRADALSPLIEKATVIAFGPGLGKSDWSRDFFQQVISLQKPMVVDADALNLLRESPIKKEQWILTPHPGEAARLLSSDVSVVQHDRHSALEKLHARYGGVIVLKGMQTLVSQKGRQAYCCDAGNPGMASGGMGDVLSGVIAGLIAQHFSLDDAAKIGVFLHATAGDLAAQANGERGLLAMDLMPHLQQLVNLRC